MAEQSSLPDEGGTPADLIREGLIDAYMDYCVAHGKPPSSLSSFAQTLGQSKKEVAVFFPSLSALESAIFAAFLSHTLALLKQSPEYAEYSPTDQLLALYYTFFELLSANRAYVMQVLPADLRLLQQLPRLRELQHDFTGHIKSLLSSLPMALPLWPGRNQLLAEGFWLQFLSLLFFWYHDNSPHFEQSDVFIEKSVAASLASLQLKPTAALLDWGRFSARSFWKGVQR